MSADAVRSALAKIKISTKMDISRKIEDEKKQAQEKAYDVSALANNQPTTAQTRQQTEVAKAAQNKREEQRRPPVVPSESLKRLEEEVRNANARNSGSGRPPIPLFTKPATSEEAQKEKSIAASKAAERIPEIQFVSKSGKSRIGKAVGFNPDEGVVKILKDSGENSSYVTVNFDNLDSETQQKINAQFNSAIGGQGFSNEELASKTAMGRKVKPLTKETEADDLARSLGKPDLASRNYERDQRREQDRLEAEELKKDLDPTYYADMPADQAARERSLAAVQHAEKIKSYNFKRALPPAPAGSDPTKPGAFVGGKDQESVVGKLISFHNDSVPEGNSTGSLVPRREVWEPYIPGQPIREKDTVKKEPFKSSSVVFRILVGTGASAQYVDIPMDSLDAESQEYAIKQFPSTGTNRSNKPDYLGPTGAYVRGIKPGAVARGLEPMPEDLVRQDKMSGKLNPLRPMGTAWDEEKNQQQIRLAEHDRRINVLRQDSRNLVGVLDPTEFTEMLKWRSREVAAENERYYGAKSTSDLGYYHRKDVYMDGRPDPKYIPYGDNSPVRGTQRQPPKRRSEGAPLPLIKREPVFNALGGVVYASKGSHINFQPKGTDTVPAMLTPGEFVINRAATQKNLPLLKSINSGAQGYERGGAVYLENGGLINFYDQVLGSSATLPLKSWDLRSDDGPYRLSEPPNARGWGKEMIDPDILDNSPTSKNKPWKMELGLASTSINNRLKLKQDVDGKNIPLDAESMNIDPRTFSIATDKEKAIGYQYLKANNDTRTYVSNEKFQEQQKQDNSLWKRFGWNSEQMAVAGMGVATYIIPTIMSTIGAGVGLALGTLGGSFLGPGAIVTGLAGSMVLGGGGDYLGQITNQLLWDAFSSAVPDYAAKIEKMKARNPKSYNTGKWIGFGSQMFLGGTAISKNLENGIRKYVQLNVGKLGNKVIPGANFPLLPPEEMKLIGETLSSRVFANSSGEGNMTLAHAGGGGGGATPKYITDATLAQQMDPSYSKAPPGIGFGGGATGGVAVGKSLAPAAAYASSVLGETQEYVIKEATKYAKGWRGALGMSSGLKSTGVVYGQIDQELYENAPDIFKSQILDHPVQVEKILQYAQSLLSSGTSPRRTLAGVSRMGGSSSKALLQNVEALSALRKNAATFQEMKIQDFLNLLTQNKTQFSNLAPDQSLNLVTDYIGQVFPLITGSTRETMGKAVYNNGARVLEGSLSVAMLQPTLLSAMKHLDGSEFVLHQKVGWTMAELMDDMGQYAVSDALGEPESTDNINKLTNKARGGPIYASKGSYINFQPKGTDTVPAMLTPGEFVVNRAATQKNLPLLKSINGGAQGYERGGVAYLQIGGGAAANIAQSFLDTSGWDATDAWDQNTSDKVARYINDRDSPGTYDDKQWGLLAAALKTIARQNAITFAGTARGNGIDLKKLWESRDNYEGFENSTERDAAHAAIPTALATAGAAVAAPAVAAPVGAAPVGAAPAVPATPAAPPPIPYYDELTYKEAMYKGLKYRQRPVAPDRNLFKTGARYVGGDQLNDPKLLADMKEKATTPEAKDTIARSEAFVADLKAKYYDQYKLLIDTKRQEDGQDELKKLDLSFGRYLADGWGVRASKDDYEKIMADHADLNPTLPDLLKNLRYSPTTRVTGIETRVTGGAAANGVGMLGDPSGFQAYVAEMQQFKQDGLDKAIEVFGRIDPTIPHTFTDALEADVDAFMPSIAGLNLKTRAILDSLKPQRLMTLSEMSGSSLQDMIDIDLEPLYLPLLEMAKDPTNTAAIAPIIAAVKSTQVLQKEWKTRQDLALEKQKIPFRSRPLVDGSENPVAAPIASQLSPQEKETALRPPVRPQDRNKRPKPLQGKDGNRADGKQDQLRAYKGPQSQFEDSMSLYKRTLGQYNYDAMLRANGQAYINSNPNGKARRKKQDDANIEARRSQYGWPQYAQNGGPIYRSRGGDSSDGVNFAPKGTDTVPAMLTPGEFVVNRSSAAKNLPLLRAINNRGSSTSYLSNGGGVEYLEGGTPGGPGVYSVRLDIADFSASTKTFLSDIKLAFTDGATSIASALGSLNNIKDFSSGLGGVTAGLTTAATLLQTNMGSLSTSLTNIATVLADIPKSIDFKVSGSIPINITVDVNGGDGLGAKLKPFSEQIFQAIEVGLKNAFPLSGITFDKTIVTD